MAHQMQISRERREMRRWARFVGTDLSMFSESPESPVNADDPVHAIPLSAVLNPEAYSKLANTHVRVEESSVDESIYERQAEMLEKEGLLTEIDSVVAQAEEKVKAKKMRLKSNPDQQPQNESGILKKIDAIAEKAEAQKKRRIKIVR
jgi:hypothetical protein